MLYPIEAQLRADRTRGPAFERSLDRMALGRALDGAEQAFIHTALSLAEWIQDPPKALEKFFEALGKMGVVIAHAPALVEQLLALPPGDQIQAASELMVTVLLARSAARASSALIDTGGSAGGLSFQVNGALGRYAISWNVGAAAAGTVGGMTAPVIIIGASGALSRADDPRTGPANSLPPPSEVTKASMKRLAKALGKEVVEARAKEIQRISADATKLVRRIEVLLARDKVRLPRTHSGPVLSLRSVKVRGIRSGI